MHGIGHLEHGDWRWRGTTGTDVRCKRAGGCRAPASRPRGACSERRRRTSVPRLVPSRTSGDILPCARSPSICSAGVGPAQALLQAAKPGAAADLQGSTLQVHTAAGSQASLQQGVEGRGMRRGGRRASDAAPGVVPLLIGALHLWCAGSQAWKVVAPPLLPPPPQPAPPGGSAL